MNLNQIILAEGKNMTEARKAPLKLRVLAEATVFIALTIVLKEVIAPFCSCHKEAPSP